MDGLPSLLAAFASAFSQDNRIFSLHFTDATLDGELLPHTVVGDEQVSSPFHLALECLCADIQLELKRLIGVGATIAIQCDDRSERVMSGIITSASQLGSNGGFARFGLIVEPALAVLKLRRNSRVFQDKSVVNIVDLILDEHIAQNPVFAQCFRHRSQLTQSYPSRSYCQQYRESDLAFIERLLREEGISYFFDFEQGAVGLHTLVLFDGGTELNPAAQASIRFHRAAATEADDAITEWYAHRQVQSGSTALASFDYKGVYTQQGEKNSVIDQGEIGNGLLANLADYDAQTLYYGSDDSELGRYATLRQQAHDLRSKMFHGKGVVRALGVGQWFTLTEHPAHEDDSESDRRFVVLRQRFTARNNLLDAFRQLRDLDLAESKNNEAGYWNDFDAVRKSVPIVPAFSHTEHAKPTARGVQTATVVGPSGEEIFTDELGRIKIQCHWARVQDHYVGQHGAGANKDDFSSCWVQVSYPSAGANGGHQFIPRIGQEVVVTFIENDIDRPVVTAVVYNGQHTPPTFSGAGSLPANKTLSGIKSQEHKGTGFNEILFDDTRNEIRTQLSSEHGKTQLNQGFLIHPRQQEKGDPRGEGFELRTDNAGTLRAAQGLLITTEPQVNASGKQLDRTAANSILDAATRLADQLGDTAKSANANQPETGKGNQTVNADTLLILSGQQGISISTPQSVAITTGSDLDQMALGDTHQTTGRRWISNAVESISLFVAGKAKEAIKLLAAKGSIQMQAQSGDIEIDGDQSLTISTCKEGISASAQKEITLACGGAVIKLSGGNIDVIAPGNISLKGARQSATGPEGMTFTPPQLPNTKLVTAKEYPFSL